MLSLTRPRFFVPIHGELRHLHAHARLARAAGHREARTSSSWKTARCWSSRATRPRWSRQVPSGDVFVDGSGVGDIGPAVMREREVLARDGFVTRRGAGQRGDRRGERQAGAGLARVRLPAGERRSDGACRRARLAGAAVRAAASRREQTIIERTQETLGRFFYEETRRKPMVVAVVTQGVTDGGPELESGGRLSSPRSSHSTQFCRRYSAYFAVSIARVSRITITLICPGYSRLSSIFLAMSFASRMDARSSISSGLTRTRTSRPAWMA